MSIKYNNKVIAGKYKEQVIPFANTIDAGIAKIATQEQINEGTDNTSIVTPVYLAQKQDKLTAGEGIHIDATNTISSKVLPDKVTIIENDNKTITTVARKTINEKLVFDWEGTEAEYHQAIMNGEIDPDWYCYITDDELSVSYNDVLSRTLVNIAPDGIKVLGASNAYLTNDVYIDEAGYNQLLELKNSAIKIDGVDNLTINGQEVAIPYVLTHTGSKIVDVKYRDTLVEFYNENGYTNYFTIDEENKNYTLPMGEIYGKLLDKDLSGISDVAKDTIKDVAGVSFSLFDTKLSDHVLSLEESVGWALQGTYVYKEAITGERFGYPTFYERCIEEKNAGIAKSVTLGSSTITMYVNDNGHQFYNIADKSIIDTYYTSFGIADFYGIDEENECIFLPRNKWFMQLTDDTANVNKFTDAGLPNITGTSSPMRTSDAGWSRSTGAFKNSSSKKNTEALEGGLYNSNSKVTSATVEDFDASRSSAVYGKSSTVQPKSSSKLLYYCVGNTKADTSWINIFAQVEEGIKEIYDQKAEVLQEIDTLRETSVDEISTLKQDSINEIGTLSATSVNEISTLNTDSLNQIETLTNENISKIENVKNTSLNELNVLKHQSVDELETLRQESVDEIGDLRQEGVNEINTLKKESIDEMEDKRISSNESITTTKDESISEFVGIASDKIQEAKSWAIGTEEERPEGSAKYWAGVAELSSSNALFDTKVSDHILQDSEAYGWELQGTYVYSQAIFGQHLGYPDFYNKCIEEYISPTNEKIYLNSNINTIGSLVNNNGVLSGFTTANYAKIPNKVNLGNNFEIVFKITTGEDITTNQRIFDGLTEQYLTCFIASNTNCFNYAFGDGTQWLQTSEEMLGKNQINSNTSYKIKITFDGTVYISYISTEEGLWIEDWRWESANIIPEYNFIIGVSRDFKTPCLCSIDLNECYININNELWWEGVGYIHKNLNGHKYYNIKNKNIIDNIYNQYGIADFYGIDETNERVLLPRNKYFHQLTGDTSKVNEMVEAGLPNITGYASTETENNAKFSGALKLTVDTNGLWNSEPDNTPEQSEYNCIEFDASLSNPIYGNSNTVQPQSSLKLLYYCVGNTKADTSWMKLAEQVGAGIKDIEDKRVESIEDIDNSRSNSITEILDTKQNSLDELEEKRVLSNESIIETKNSGIQELITTSEDLINESRKWAIGTEKENPQGSAKFWAETAQLSSSNALFDTKVSDHVLEGPDAYGWVLQGTYVYKDAVLNEHLGYPTFYEKCIEEKNAGTATSVTLGSNTLTIYKNTNGHQYYNIADKSKIDAWYTTYGVADYYGIDEENECIFLPRNKWFQQLTDDINSVNTFKQAGLPNHKHYEFGTTGGAGADGDPPSNKLSATAQVRSSGGGGYGRYLLAQDSKEATVGLSSNPIDQTIYGKSTTVQPQSSLKLLYYCVGNTKADTSWMKLTEQVQEGIKEIYEEKVKSLEELDTLRQESVQEVTDTKLDSVNKLETTTLEGLQSLAGASNALTHNQITNCLLEVPQRIKLELTDGTLTLKAGSQVIIPNGFEEDRTTPKFDYVTIESDVTGGFTGYTFTAFVSYRVQTGTLIIDTVGTDPSATGNFIYYNTDENLVQLAGTTGDLSQLSFPIGIVSMDSTIGVKSIDQVFNGLGYIGSTVWVDKNVKCLVPDGRSLDGTFNNIVYQTNKFKTFTRQLTENDVWIMLGPNGFVTSHIFEYNEDLNRVQNIGTDNYVSYACIGLVDMNEGLISNFKPKNTFHTIDYNDLKEVHCIIETYKSGASWYRIWSDGWIEQGGNFGTAFSSWTAKTITFLKPFSDVYYYVSPITGHTSNTDSPCINAKTVNTFSCTVYNSTGNACWYACGY